MQRHPVFHHIADDHHRNLLVQHAIRKGIEQARGDFFYALVPDGVDDETLGHFGRDAWAAFHRQVTFDYPQFAETLYLHAYRTAYRRHLDDVAHGRHTDPVALARTIEIALGLIAQQDNESDGGGNGDSTGAVAGDDA